jgi:peptidoglycan L-alanyl-D-glutamate endopeptidase CwlK
MAYVLGKTSEANLIGVHPKLVCCVRYAIRRSEQDFSVFEGLRTLERQRKLVASGASRTLDSYHLTGEAVDLVPYVDGRVQWQMPLCIKIARVMLQASRDLAVPLVWGAVWDRELGSLDPEELELAIEDYTQRFRGKNSRPPLIDGPHFQLVRSEPSKAAA